MPRIWPNRIPTRSPANELERETITTPSASIATKSRPIAVSDDSRERRVIRLTPAIIASAPTAAPTIPGSPSRSAPAMPGSTPWARASPMKASPRRTTKVPTIAQAIETSTPADERAEHELVLQERIDERAQQASLGCGGRSRAG